MTRLHIANMACEACLKGVTATLRRVLPDAAITVDLARREVSLNDADIAAALAALRQDDWDAREA